MVGERRSAARFELELPVLLTNDRGTARNMSTSGLMFAACRPLEAGADIQLALLLGQAESAASRLHCTGRVVRSARWEDQWHIAVQVARFRFESGPMMDTFNREGTA